MNTAGASGPSGLSLSFKGLLTFLNYIFSGPGGKKNRQKERRLMKGFLSANPSMTAGGSPSPSQIGNHPGDVLTKAMSRTSLLTPSNDISIDITNIKKTPTNLARKAKLLYNKGVNNSE